MEDMLAVMVNDPVAAAAGLAAMVCLAIWPLFRALPTMLMVYIGNNVGFVAHYALLGDRTAAAMNGLLAVQTLVAIWLVRQPRLRWVYYALMPVLAGTGFVTWQGLASFLAAAATTLSTVGRMQANEIVLRLLLLASTPFWAAHDFLVGSLPGLTADLLSMTTGAMMLLQRSPAARTALMRAKEQLWRPVPKLALSGTRVGAVAPSDPRSERGSAGTRRPRANAVA